MHLTLCQRSALLFSAIFLSTALPTAAQLGSQRNDWAIGANTGLSLNQVSFNPGVRQTYSPGGVWGFTARYTSERYYGLICALQIEANYWQAGWKEDIYSSQGEKLPDSYRRNVNYIQLPLLANLGLGNEYKGLKGFLLAGPQISYAIADHEERSSTWTTTMTNGQETPNRSNNVYAQYGKALDHKIDYGITAGLGIELTTGIGHFIVDARYYYGLSDLFGNAKKDPFSRSANGAIMVKVTYLINIPKSKN